MSAASFINRPLSTGLVVPPGQDYLAQPLAGMPGCERQVYVITQSRPVFPDPKIFQQSTPGTPGKILSADLGGKTDVLLDGPWDLSVIVDGASGQRGIPLRIASRNKSNILGKEGSIVHAFATLNTPNFLELYDLNLRAGDGQSGIVWGPLPTVTNRGSVIRMFGCKAKNIGYAGMLLSVGIAGYEYKKIVAVNFWMDGLITEGEVQYFGHDTTESTIRVLVVIGTRGTRKGRETDQERYVDDCRIYNVTGRNVGRVTGQPGQNNTNQVQNTNGFKKNCLYDGAPIVENIITHGFTFDGGFVRIDGGPLASGYIGKANDHWPGSPRLNATYVPGQKKLVIKNRFFYADTATPEVYLLEETDCDVDVINCVVTDTFARFFTDIRGGSPSNVITLTNVKFVPRYSVPRPTFASDDVDNTDFCTLTSSWHIAKGFGAGTVVQGPKDIVDAWELPDQTVANGTTFASLVLPQYCPFLLSDGNQRMMNVTWVQGSYDGTTPGTYSIFATPRLDPDTLDPFSEKVELLVTVNGPPTVNINLTRSGGSYVTGLNWNNIEGSGTGVQQARGDSNGATLSFLRNTDGNPTTMNLTINSFMQAEGKGTNSAGLLPAAANIDELTSFAGGRSLKITGMTVGHDYRFKIICAVNTSFGAATVDIAVSGGATTITVTGHNESGTTGLNNYVSSASGIVMRPNGSGETTITVTPNVGQGVINAIVIEDL